MEAAPSESIGSGCAPLEQRSAGHVSARGHSKRAPKGSRHHSPVLELSSLHEAELPSVEQAVLNHEHAGCSCGEKLGWGIGPEISSAVGEVFEIIGRRVPVILERTTPANEVAALEAQLQVLGQL